VVVVAGVFVAVAVAIVIGDLVVVSVVDSVVR